MKILDKRTEKEKTDKSCWSCAYQDVSRRDTFLGVCTWFSQHNKGKDKEIPPNVVDVGCKHWILATQTPDMPWSSEDS